MSPTVLESPSPSEAVILDQKTAIRWPLVAALIAVAVAAAGGIATAQSAEACCRSATEDVRRHDLRIQRTEDAQAVSAEVLKEIKLELREINRKLDAGRK